MAWVALAGRAEVAAPCGQLMGDMCTSRHTNYSFARIDVSSEEGLANFDLAFSARSHARGDLAHSTRRALGDLLLSLRLVCHAGRRWPGTGTGVSVAYMRAPSRWTWHYAAHRHPRDEWWTAHRGCAGMAQASYFPTQASAVAVAACLATAGDSWRIGGNFRDSAGDTCHSAGMGPQLSCAARQHHRRHRSSAHLGALRADTAELSLRSACLHRRNQPAHWHRTRPGLRRAAQSADATRDRVG